MSGSSSSTQKLKKSLWDMVDESTDEETTATLSSSISRIEISETDLLEEFLCSISRLVMKDPVVTARGHTFERAMIEKQFDGGNMTCPKSGLTIPTKQLVPNRIISELIQDWCKTVGNYRFSGLGLDLNRTDHRILVSLLKKLTSTALSDQREADRKLFLITKEHATAQRFLFETRTIFLQLINPLLKKKPEDEIDAVLQEDLMGIISRIEENDINMVTTTPGMIPVLAECLKRGSIQTKKDTLNTIFTMSLFQRYSIRLCDNEVMSELCNLLGGEDTPSDIVDSTVKAITQLWGSPDNLNWAGLLGGVVLLLGKQLEKKVNIVKITWFITMLSSNYEDAAELLLHSEHFTPMLSQIMNETDDLDIQENCLIILCDILLFCEDPKKMNEHKKIRKIVKHLSKHGSDKVQKASTALLNLFS